ncbi:MAG: T9SS type A sorting domain-containing protein [Bacteroidia bacterium]|nr:T9SS type A sorting domain-containing protein [Bacteroidia bacterium]
MMKRTIYTLLTACVALFVSLPVMAQQSDYKLLYIANNDPATGGDARIIASLDSLGYVVTAIPAASFNEFSHTDFSADVVVFGEALGSGAVMPFANASYPVPCVSMEGYCVRENRWALVASNDDFGQILPATSSPAVVSDPTKHFGITVKADHPITNYAGLSVGQSIDWSGQRDSSAQVTYFTLQQTAATVVADIQGETDLHTLYAIEPDATDANNPLNHRLVIWGVHEFGLLDYNSVFVKILDGAILWTLGENTTSIETSNFVEGLTAQPNPFTDRTSVEFSLANAGQVSLEVYDLAGRVVAREAGLYGAGSQAIDFVRPEMMTSGMYHFSLKVNGKLFGSGKMMVR